MGDGLVLGLRLIVGVVTLLPFWKSTIWWVRVTEFPRIQWAVLALVLVGSWPWTGWPLAVKAVAELGMLACLIYQGWRIFPFTRLARRQVHSAKHPRPSDELTLLVANVLMTNRAVDRLLALIRRYDPDLILLVETDAWWTNQLQQALAKAYPFSVRQPQRNTYGMALFSRLTLLGPEVRFLIEEDVPSIRTRVLLRNGIPVWFYGVHPRPPVPTEDPTSTARDAELLVVGREVKAIREPVIVAGDLNDVAWSSTTRLFQHISGLLDPRRGRGFFNTYHARWPLLRWPLDHVFHSKHFWLRRLRRLPYWGSDHFPVLITLQFAPEAGHVQEESEASREEKREASEKIATARSDSAP